jgi:hypothetical protein
LSHPDVVFRAISRTSYDLGRHWPALEPPVAEQRWNREDQPTIYASHEQEIAAAEKLGHLAKSGTLSSARAFWSTAPRTDEVFIVSFDPAVFQGKLADVTQMANIGDFLAPDYTASQDLAGDLLGRGFTAVRAPSALFWPDMHANEAYFVTRDGQVQRHEFPIIAEHGLFKGGA